VNKDLEEKSLSEEDVNNRGRWRLLSKNADPTLVGKGQEEAQIGLKRTFTPAVGYY
jgi:hypothetical protein